MIEQVRIVLRIFIANKRFLQRDRRRNAGHAERGEASNKDGPLWPGDVAQRRRNVGKYSTEIRRIEVAARVIVHATGGAHNAIEGVTRQQFIDGGSINPMHPPRSLQLGESNASRKRGSERTTHVTSCSVCSSRGSTWTPRLPVAPKWTMRIPVQVSARRVKTISLVMRASIARSTQRHGTPARRDGGALRHVLRRR